MLDVTLRQCQILQLVSEAGSFSAAAERLGISQPAISKQISALEAKFGFSMFVRRRGAAVELTIRGATILSEVSHLLNSANTLEAMTGEATSRQTKVRILAGRFIAHYVVIPNLGRLRLQRPDLIVEITALDSPRRAFEPALRQAPDLIYVSLLEKKAGHDQDIIDTAQMVFAASPSHPVVKKLSKGMAPCLPMIMGVPGEALDALIRKALLTCKISNYATAHNVQLPEVMISLAVSGAGVCCIMPYMIKEELKQGVLVELTLPKLPLYRYALRNGGTWNDDVRYVDTFVRSLIRAIH